MKRFWTNDYNQLSSYRSEYYLHASRNTPYRLVYKGRPRYMGSIINQYNITSCIDYGCGHGQSMLHHAERSGMELVRYDPFVPEFRDYPDRPADMIVLYNVLNIIEDEWFDPLMSELYRLCNKIVVANITTPGGYGRDALWYLKEILDRHDDKFKILETSLTKEPEFRKLWSQPTYQISLPDIHKGQLYLLLKKVQT